MAQKFFLVEVDIQSKHIFCQAKFWIKFFKVFNVLPDSSSWFSKALCSK